VDNGLKAEGLSLNQTIKVPPTATDHAPTVAQISPDADAVDVTVSDAFMIQFTTAFKQSGLKTQLISTVGTINEHVIEETGGSSTPLNGTLLYSPFPSPGNPAWGDLTEVLKNAPSGTQANIADQTTQAAWVAMLVLKDVLSDASDVSAAGLTKALDSATAVDTEGLTPPLDFSKPFEAPYSRIFNRATYFLVIKDGKFESVDNDTVHDISDAILGK
jgi:ABC-type branched-subunit amino acid transport system substrate-binding protein